MIDTLMQLILIQRLLIVYLSNIESLICRSEIEFKRVSFIQFCTKYDTRFLTNVTKKMLETFSVLVDTIVL